MYTCHYTMIQIISPFVLLICKRCLIPDRQRWLLHVAWHSCPFNQYLLSQHHPPPPQQLKGWEVVVPVPLLLLLLNDHQSTCDLRYAAPLHCPRHGPTGRQWSPVMLQSTRRSHVAQQRCWLKNQTSIGTFTNWIHDTHCAWRDQKN